MKSVRMSITVRCKGNDVHPVQSLLFKRESAVLLQCLNERDTWVNDTRGTMTQCRPSLASEMARAGLNVNDDART